MLPSVADLAQRALERLHKTTGPYKVTLTDHAIYKTLVRVKDVETGAWVEGYMRGGKFHVRAQGSAR
jgi:hypothetical protein